MALPGLATTAWPGTRRAPRAAARARVSVSAPARWARRLNTALPRRHAAQAQTDSALGEGGVRTRSGGRGAARGVASSGPRAPPAPPPRQESARARRAGEWAGPRAGHPVPQRPSRRQALTWPPSEPPSCGSETNAWLGAAAARRPPRVRRAGPERGLGPGGHGRAARGPAHCGGGGAVRTEGRPGLGPGRRGAGRRPGGGRRGQGCAGPCPPRWRGAGGEAGPGGGRARPGRAGAEGGRAGVGAPPAPRAPAAARAQSGQGCAGSPTGPRAAPEAPLPAPPRASRLGGSGTRKLRLRPGRGQGHARAGV